MMEIDNHIRKYVADVFQGFKRKLDNPAVLTSSVSCFFLMKSFLMSYILSMSLR